MPGFQVTSHWGERMGDAAGPHADSAKPFYTYTWTIPHLFGESAGSLSDVTAYCSSATLPAVTHRREEVEGSSVIYKYAKDVIWEDVRVTFYDVVAGTPSSSMSMMKRLKAWREKVWSVSTGIGIADDGEQNGYKRDTRIMKHTHDGSVKEGWLLKGSWPQSIKFGELTYGKSEVNIIDVVITYDWAIEVDAAGNPFPSS